MVCILMPDRTVFRLRLSTPNAEQSILSNLVLQRQGQIVNLAVESERGMLRNTCLINQIATIPQTCEIRSASWQSSSCLVLGLTIGGILSISFLSNGSSEEIFLQPLQVGVEGGFVSNLLNRIPQFWQQQQGIRGHLIDILAVASYANGCVSLDGEGNLKLFDVRTRGVVGHVNVVKLLSDTEQESVQICNAKLCLLFTSNRGILVVATAIELQTPEGCFWQIGIFTFEGSRHCFVGTVSHQHKTDSSKISLVDLQFSTEPSETIGQFSLNTLWRRDGFSLFYTSPFQFGSSGSRLEMHRVRSNRDQIRIEMLKSDQAIDLTDKNRDSMLLQRVFSPGRFSMRTIVEVLIRDIPFEFQLLPDDAATKAQDLAGLVDCVTHACSRWGAKIRDTSSAYLELINLCHKRSLADDECGSACLLAVRECSASKYRSFIAHRDGLWLVAEVQPKSSDKLERHLIEGDARKELLRLRARMSQYFQLKPVIGEDIVASVREVFIASAKNAISALGITIRDAEDIYRNTINTPCVEFEDCALRQESGLSEQMPYNAFDLQCLVTDIARVAVNSAITRHQTRAVAFAIFQLLSSNSAATEQSFNQSINYFIYCSFLMWLDTVRLTSDDALRQCTDLEGVYPGSFLLSFVTDRQYRLDRGSGTNSNLGEMSIFTHFWCTGQLSLRYCDDSFDAPSHGVVGIARWIEACSRRCMFALRPSCMGDLVTHLVAQRQYACLRRIGSFLRINFNASQFPAHKMMHFFQRIIECRIMGLEHISCFHECLRRQACRRQAYGGITDDSMSLDEQNHCFDNHQDILDSAPQERKDWGPTVEELARAHPESLHLDDFFEQVRLRFSDMNVLDSIYCVRDVLVSMLHSQGSPFAAVMESRGRKLDENFLSGAFLQNLVRSSYLADVVDIFRRARSVLPTNLGSKICVNGGECQMETLRNIKLVCGDSSSKMYSCLESADLATWNRIFNASLEALNFSEAWIAVVNMLKLEDYDLVGRTSSVHQWLVCLRSLVSLACDSGHLWWLCELPDELVTLPRGKVIWLADEVVKELERLAKTSGVDGLLHAGGGDFPQTVNYYEALYAFLLSRKCYVDAAHAILGFCVRHDNHSSVHKAR